MSAVVVATVVAFLFLPGTALGSWGGALSALDAAITLFHDLFQSSDKPIPTTVINTHNNIYVFLPSKAAETQARGTVSLNSPAIDVAYNVNGFAAQVGQAVSQETHNVWIGQGAEHKIRDCAKLGLHTTAWNLWWGWESANSFSPDQVLQGTITSCLETNGAEYATANSVAGTIVYYVDQGAMTALQGNNDVAALSNWLEAIGSFYIPI